MRILLLYWSYQSGQALYQLLVRTFDGAARSISLVFSPSITPILGIITSSLVNVGYSGE